MDRIVKRYIGTLVLGIAGPLAASESALALFGSSDVPAAGYAGGAIIVGSFAVTAALVAREKGRSLWYGLAGWIAPLLPIVLLLPYTKQRQSELMGLHSDATRPPRGGVECPRCSLISPEGALACDCGFQFGAADKGPNAG